jgi:hypothetical protein
VGEGGDGEKADAGDADSAMCARRRPCRDPPTMGRLSSGLPWQAASASPPPDLHHPCRRWLVVENRDARERERHRLREESGEIEGGRDGR